MLLRAPSESSFLPYSLESMGPVINKNPISNEKGNASLLSCYYYLLNI